MLDGNGVAGPDVACGAPAGIVTILGFVKVVVEDVESGDSATLFSCEAKETNEGDEPGRRSPALEAADGREPISRLSAIKRIRDVVKILPRL
jgi:hypothetical protein